jgi:hypothetical protein
MLAISFGFKSSSISFDCWKPCVKSLKGVTAVKVDASIRPEELSTRITRWRDGSEADSTLLAARFGTILFKRDTFSRGLLYGRFVSVPIIK